MMGFIWIALVYVIVAFTDITAGTFVAGDESLIGETRFNPGGAVAIASVMYLGLSIVLGLVERYLKPPLWLVDDHLCSRDFRPFVSRHAVLVCAQLQPFHLVGDHPDLLRCRIARSRSGLCLQPRGYLGGFVLYAAIAVGVIGMFFGGYSIQQPAFKSFDVGGMTGMLFPFLFVTIACGACSGFHGLVCSGTTSKQIDKEAHVRPVGYGAMLAEGFVAFIALVTVMIAASDMLVGPDGKSLPAGKIYGNGIGNFMTLLIGKRTCSSRSRSERWRSRRSFSTRSTSACGSGAISCRSFSAFRVKSGRLSERL